MQRVLTQQLYALSNARIREMFPSAEIDRAAKRPPGCRVWPLVESARLKIFLTLIPSPKKDAFTFEISWTTGEAIPQTTGGPETPLSQGSASFRVSYLWSPGVDFWWNVGTEVRWSDMVAGRFYDGNVDLGPALHEQAQDAFKRLEQFAVPYVKELAHAGGIYFGKSLNDRGNAVDA
jgi:hypothetical protein